MDRAFLAVLAVLVLNVLVINAVAIVYLLLRRAKGEAAGDMARWFALNLAVYLLLALVFFCVEGVIH